MVKGIVFVMLLAMLIASIRRPAYAVSAVLCMFVMEQWAQALDIFFLHNNQLLNLAFGVIVIVALISSVVRFGWPLVDYPVAGYLTLLFFLYCFISTFWSPEFQQSYDIFLSAFPYMAVFLIIPPLLVKNIEDFRAVIIGYLVIGAFLTFTLLVTVNWENRGIILGAGRQIARGNPLEIGTMGGNLIVMAMLMIASFRTPAKKLSMYFIAFIATILLIKSGSRGQLLFAMGALLLFWPLAKGKGSIANTVVVLFSFAIFGVIVSTALNFFWHGNSRWTIDKMYADFMGRFDMSTALLGHWVSDAAAIVIGLGNSSSYHLIGYYPHIVPLEILAEEGFIGFLLFLSIVLLAFRATIQMLLRTAGNVLTRPLIAVYGGLFVYSLGLTFKQGSAIGSLVFFFFCVAVCKLARVHQKL